MGVNMQLTINSDNSLSSAIGELREAYRLHKFLRLSVKTGKDRSLDQNNLMWEILTAIAKQVDWYGQKLAKEEWKDVLTASLKKQKAVPGLDGGFVVLGARTSKMTIQEMSDVIELAYAFGAEHGVRFTAQASAEQA